MMTRRSRVALIHYAAPPVVGGVEQVMRRHADLMATHGFSVQVVAGRGEAWDTHVPVDLIPLLDSRHPDVLAAKARLDTGVIPEGFEDLVSRIEQGLTNTLGDVDIVIAHNVCSLHKNLALTVALHRKFETGTWRKLILWHHDLAWLSPRYAGELHDGYPWDLLRRPWGATQVVVSRFRQEQLADLLGMEAQKIHVVPNGVSETESLRLGAETQALVRKLGLDQAHPRLLLPARVTRRKNIELAVAATATVRQQMPQVAMLVTGPAGPHNPANLQYWNELHGLRDSLGLEGHVYFLAKATEGSLSPRVVNDLFRWSDALLFPSREEGFGIPILEACMARMPIFCSNIDPLMELVRGHVTGFSPDESPAAVGEFIVKRLQSDAAYALSVRARTTFEWERVFEKHVLPLVEA
jgi:glycosyltransferase involved in cell wall biosynthesis